VAALLVPAAARAGDDSFPTALDVFVPADRPDEIVVATNLGFVFSEDGGRTWAWSCEHGHYPLVPQTPYQVGPPPRDRLFAYGGAGVEYSDDGSCTWQLTSGVASNSHVYALFLDATDADRALASVSISDGDGGAPTYAVLASSDGGATFGRPLYASAGAAITSLASARSDPATIYLTLSAAGGPATLVRSLDGGASWEPLDLGGIVGPGRVAILGVDPVHADRLYLRYATATDQAFVVATNGGAAAARTLALPAGQEIHFLRASDGTLLVSAFTWNAAASLFRSFDGGATFSSIPGPPGIHGLAERDGVLYAATDSTYSIDTFNADIDEMTSTDQGTTWQPGLSFANVQGIIPCAKALCQDQCSYYAEFLWTPAVCSADLPVRDAGAPDAADAAAPDAPPGADAVLTVGSDGGDGPIVKLAGHRGCRCAVGGERGDATWLGGVLAVLLLVLRRRARARS